MINADAALSAAHFRSDAINLRQSQPDQVRITLGEAVQVLAPINALSSAPILAALANQDHRKLHRRRLKQLPYSPFQQGPSPVLL